MSCCNRCPPHTPGIKRERTRKRPFERVGQAFQKKLNSTKAGVAAIMHVNQKITSRERSKKCRSWTGQSM
jgi:hypothetical protein